MMRQSVVLNKRGPKTGTTSKSDIVVKQKKEPAEEMTVRGRKVQVVRVNG